MKVLVINCGSSSLKFQLIDSDSEECLAKGLCERIGIEGSMITYAPKGGDKEKTETPMPDHTEAIRLVLEALINPKTGVVKNLDEIGAVGHRVGHGGEKGDRVRRLQRARPLESDLGKTRFGLVLG